MERTTYPSNPPASVSCSCALFSRRKAPPIPPSQPISSPPVSLSWICSSAVKCVFAIANANSRGDFIERDRARVDPIRGDALDSPQRSGYGHPSARLERADVLQWRGIGSGGNATATNCRFIGGAEMLATLARVALALFLVVIVYRMV